MYIVLFLRCLALIGKISLDEMFSLPETKVEKMTNRQDKASQLLKVNYRYFTRIYPHGLRIDSSNYDPVAMWNCGCQLTALNYQTPGNSVVDSTSERTVVFLFYILFFLINDYLVFIIKYIVSCIK